MTESKVSLEVAKDQMQEFLDYYDIDQDDIVVEQGPEAVKTIMNRLIRAIRSGNLEIRINDGSLSVIQRLRNPPGDILEITYKEIGGEAKRAMDAVPETKPALRMQTFMGYLSGLNADAIKKLKGADYSIVERLAILFMVV